MKSNKIMILIMIFFGVIVFLKVSYNYSVSNYYYYSLNEEESKQLGVYIETLKIDSLVAYPPYNISSIQFIKFSKIWKEHRWHRKPFLIFFHPIQIEKSEAIVIKCKELGSLQSKLLFIRVKNWKHSGEIRGNDIVGLPNIIFNTNETIELEIYHNKKDILGSVILSKKH